MNGISSRSAMSLYTSPFNSTGTRQTKSNDRQSSSHIANNNTELFQKNIENNQKYIEQNQRHNEQGQLEKVSQSQNFPSYSILDDSLPGVSKSSKSEKIDSHEVYIEKTMENIRNGDSIVDAMMKAKSEVFELLLKEELEFNGNNVKEAAKEAKINLKMEISDQEMLGVMHDMIQELKDKPNRTPEEDILMHDLGDVCDNLAKKISAEYGRENLSEQIKLDAKTERVSSNPLDKADSLTNTSPLQAKNASPQNNKELIHLLNENYLYGKNATSKSYDYEPVDIII